MSLSVIMSGLSVQLPETLTVPLAHLDAHLALTLRRDHGQRQQFVANDRSRTLLDGAQREHLNRSNVRKTTPKKARRDPCKPKLTTDHTDSTDTLTLISVFRAIRWV
jgi:hypothetical protein